MKGQRRGSVSLSPMEKRLRLIVGLALVGGLAGLAAKKIKQPPSPEGTWKDAVPSLNGSGPSDS